MPRRQRIKRFESEEIQGDGSYVKCSALTIGERRDISTFANEEHSEMDIVEWMLDILAANVHEWNWVDDAGEPLPQVVDDPDVVDALTNEEVKFLMDCIKDAPNTKN